MPPQSQSAVSETSEASSPGETPLEAPDSACGSGPRANETAPGATPPSRELAPAAAGRLSTPEGNGGVARKFSDWLRVFRRLRSGNGSVRDTLEEIIEEREEAELPIAADERLLLANILTLKDRTVGDVMVPRADVVAVDKETPFKETIRLIKDHGHSRLPVYEESLDDAIGMVHSKDLLTFKGRSNTYKPEKILRKLLFVTPSMHVLELLLEMRVTRSHMALVVDEYGGVDGLVTIEDLVEEIVGEIEDEHDRNDEPRLLRDPDGSWRADARVEIKTLEDELGEFADEEEREDIVTLGGLVFALAGRVPIRGELITHETGVEFEILDAGPRRIKRLRVRRREGKASETGSRDGGA